MSSHLMGVYNRAPLAVDHGKGPRLYATDGTVYLDCVSGISTNALGHAHPRLVQAVKDQAEKLWHVSNIFQIPGQEELADADVENVLAILEEVGAQKESHSIVETSAQEALEALEPVALPPWAKNEVESLVEFLARREF